MFYRDFHVRPVCSKDLAGIEQLVKTIDLNENLIKDIKQFNKVRRDEGIIISITCHFNIIMHHVWYLVKKHVRAIPFKHTSPPGRHSEIGGITHRSNFLLCVTLNRSDFESDVTTNRSKLFFQKFCYWQKLAYPNQKKHYFN